MSFNYPDFLQSSNPSSDEPHFKPPVSAPTQSSSDKSDQQKQPPQSFPQGSDRHFNDLLFNKLSSLENYNHEPLANSDNLSNKSPTSGPMNDYLIASSIYAHKDSFNLPLELQGGIGNISSRRPSYAAESFTRSNFPPLNYLNSGNSPQLNSINNPSSGDGGQSSFFGGNNSGNIASSKNLSSYAMMNNFNQSFNMDQFSDGLANLNLNSNLNDFQARRPSQLVDFQQPQFSSSLQQQFFPPPLSIGENHSFVSNLQQGQNQQQFHHQSNQQGQQSKQQQQQQPQQQQHQIHLPMGHVPGHPMQPQNQSNAHFNQSIKLENGLILKDQYIVASPDLKNLYSKTIKYFQDPELTNDILNRLHGLLADPIIVKLITFIKNMNNLTFNHKILCLVINKNGKFDLLSYPNNSNIFLQRDDLVIVDGDRGKDSVMIVEPLVNLNFAILFNFLKKLEHLKSLTIDDGNNGNSSSYQRTIGTHSTLLDASAIINSHSNEDNEFIITLPTKQVLRFATPKEIHKISGKFLEEKKAFITCYNKIKELNLEKDLTLINVEYQSDFKKLIFYYFANFKRIDFRGLIKELFKIYKTRIWLCAVLPYDKPYLYTKTATNKTEESKEEASQLSVMEANLIPKEYELTNEQILNFSINEIEHLSKPNYFHSINLLNLIKYLTNDIKGHFYGFNTAGSGNFNNNSGTTNKSTGNNRSKHSHSKNTTDHSKILPSFNPFGDMK